MIAGWTVALLAFGYVSALFTLAWVGDRFIRPRRKEAGRPLIYALSLAVYCSSWTFFGSVGLAASTGYDFLPVYLGPILMFAVGWPVISRIVRLAKSQNITSVADFLAARYGKSPAVAAIVTGVMIAGSLPYMALQLKAVAVSIDTLLGPDHLIGLNVAAGFNLDTGLLIAIALAAFAVLFGTRHIDATEHQEGLMLAIAAESIVKIVAFLLDDTGHGGTILVVTGAESPDAMIGVVETLCLAAAADTRLCRLVVASIRPEGATRPGDIDRWLEASAIADLHDIDLVEWFVIGPAGPECPRDLLGEPERW